MPDGGPARVESNGEILVYYIHLSHKIHVDTDSSSRYLVQTIAGNPSFRFMNL